MPGCKNMQKGGEAGSARLRKAQKGAGHGFTGKEGVLGRGSYATTKYSDCCPPKKDPSEHMVNSISPILKGGSYKKKLSKKMKKLSKKMRKGKKKSLKKGKKMVGGADCGKGPKSDHSDPSVRKFGCRQDKWSPDCI